MGLATRLSLYISQSQFVHAALQDLGSFLGRLSKPELVDQIRTLCTLASKRCVEWNLHTEQNNKGLKGLKPYRRTFGKFDLQECE